MYVLHILIATLKVHMDCLIFCAGILNVENALSKLGYPMENIKASLIERVNFEFFVPNFICSSAAWRFVNASFFFFLIF